MENIFINKCNELKLNSDQTELALIFFQLGNKSNNFNYKFKDEIIEDCPKFVGKLNKKFGYNGFKPIEVGTDVYEFNNSYYFEMIKETDNLKVKQIFNKETLKKCIDFNE